MTKTKTIASGPAPKPKKTVKKKIEQAVVEPAVELVEEVKEAASAAVDSTLEELNEPVETFTIRKSWLVVAAIVVTVVAIAFIL